MKNAIGTALLVNLLGSTIMSLIITLSDLPDNWLVFFYYVILFYFNFILFSVGGVIGYLVIITKLTGNTITRTLIFTLTCAVITIVCITFDDPDSGAIYLVIIVPMSISVPYIYRFLETRKPVRRKY